MVGAPVVAPPRPYPAAPGAGPPVDGPVVGEPGNPYPAPPGGAPVLGAVVGEPGKPYPDPPGAGAGAAPGAAAPGAPVAGPIGAAPGAPGPDMPAGVVGAGFDAGVPVLGVLDAGEELAGVDGACAVLDDPEPPVQPTIPDTSMPNQTNCQRRRIRNTPVHSGAMAQSNLER